MNVMANELKEVLAIMTVVAGSDREMESGSNIYFTGEKLVLFNGDAYIEKEMKTEFAGGVNAALFEDIIEKYGTNEIEIYREENNLIVKRKRSVSKLAMDDNIQAPKIKLGENEWRNTPADFCALLEQCVQFTSNNFNEPCKVCIHLNGRKMESGDGFHFGIFKMKGNIPDDIFIRKDFVKILSKFEPKSYTLTESWICFKNEKGYFSAIRKTDVPDYPNLEEHYGSCEGKFEIELSDKLISSLERAELFLRSELEFDRYIKMDAADGKITISVKTKAGSYTDKISIPPDVNFSIAINPKYLVEMLFFTNKFSIAENAITCETKTVKMASSFVG